MQQLTVGNFEAAVKQQAMPAVVMFYAIWCGKCAMMKSVAEDLEKKYSGRIQFFEVDVDESEVLAAEYNAGIVPTFVLFKNGKAVGIMQGMIDDNVFDQRIMKMLRNAKA